MIEAEVVPTITIDELREKIERADEFVLVDALAPMVYAHSHLPGAINMPPTAIDATTISRRLPDTEAEIVVYCSNPDCEDSHETAARLRALGYANVRRYSGGKDEWREANLPLERAGKPYVPR